jgi:hypothetical protein
MAADFRILIERFIAHQVLAEVSVVKTPNLEPNGRRNAKLTEEKQQA